MKQTNIDFFLDNKRKKEMFWLTIVLAILVSTASVFSLVNPDAVYMTQEINQAYFPSDIGILIFGLPFLLLTLWKLSRDKFLGLLLWPGALFFVLYSYALYLFGIPYELFFWIYFLITGLSLFLLVKLLSNIDVGACRSQFAENTPTKFASIVLMALGALIFFRVIGLVSSALIDSVLVSKLDMALWITDFIIAAPALIYVGWQLWRRKPFAYVTAPGLLAQYIVLSLGLIPVFVYQAKGEISSIDMGGLIVVIIMVIVCVIPLIQLLKSMRKIK